MIKLQASEQVNRVAKYLYKHIDGAYKLGFSPNVADVYMRMYYQIPGDASTFQEMKFDINITTYQNKIRINTTEMTEYEETIGQDIYRPEQLEDLQDASVTIIDKIIGHITSKYEEYDFIF